MGLAQANIYPDLETWTDERIAYMVESAHRFGERQAKALAAAQAALGGGSGTGLPRGPGTRQVTAASLGYRDPRKQEKA